MPHRKCAVRGCDEDSAKMYWFPNPSGKLERCRQWIAATGNSDLLQITEKQLRQKVICTKHFENKYILQTKLSQSAIPTLFLPEPINASDFLRTENSQPMLESTGTLDNKIADLGF